MGLFGNLFEKKICDACGQEIKLLGNRKLADGNLCKNCAEKLSPWFSERKESTVAEIQEQLDYRAANEEDVQAFELTRTLGSGTKVLLDENHGKFMITGASNYRTANPDVLDFSQVTGCNVDVKESKSEVRKKLPDGKYESYNPQQYDYSYDIYVTVYVNHPYFNEMRFKVNSGSIQIKNTLVSKENGMNPQPVQQRPAGQPAQQRPGANQVQRPGMNQVQRPGTNQTQRPGMNQTQRPGIGQPAAGGMNMGARRMMAFVPHPENNADYREAESAAYEIKEVLTQAREASRAAYEQANAVKTACTCPFCGATTIPDANGCCEYCGGAIGSIG